MERQIKVMNSNTGSGRIRVRQVGSPIGRTRDQRATLVGLGLNNMHRTSTLEDTPSVRGMIAKVKHLVTFEAESEGK